MNVNEKQKRQHEWHFKTFSCVKGLGKKKLLEVDIMSFYYAKLFSSPPLLTQL